MNPNLLRRAGRFCAGLIFFGLTVTALAFAGDQQPDYRDGNQKSPESAIDGSQRHPDDPITVVEEEMRAKRAIIEADKEYQENLGRARDLSSLGLELVTSFKQKNALNHDDIKKLEKVEKLAKGIRSAAGGSDDKVDIESPPTDLASAMNMLSELSQSLKVKVEKTPKHVISADVIDEANVLLELIRIVRNLPAKV